LITPEARTSLDKDAVLAACAGRWLSFYGQYTELKRQGSEYRGACPLHGGDGPNFAVNAETGLWHCFTGCQDAGGDALKFLQRKDGFTFPEALQELARFTGTTPTPAPSRNGHQGNGYKNGPAPRIVATYNYTDEDGTVLFQCLRWEPGWHGKKKSFSQRQPDGTGWINNIDGVRRVLYALPEVLAAVDTGKPVFVCEGEKATDAVRSLGLCATTNPMGAEKKWEDGYTEALCGARVIILPDNDTPGHAHAQKVAAALHGRAKRVRVVELPNLPEKGDAFDWIEAGGTKDGLLALVKAALDWNPDSAPSPATACVSEWPAPMPFNTSALPPFPTEALPSVLGAYVSEVARSVCVPADLPALLGLAVVATAAARRCQVNVGLTHIEPMCLFCAVVMESGSGKSAVVPAMRFPLEEHEDALVQSAQADIASASSRRVIEDKRLAHLQEAAAKDKDAAKREEAAREAEALAGELTVVPNLPRLLADDATSQRLTGIMADNGGACAIHSPEGGVFTLMAGKYSNKEVDIELFLKGHAGDEIRVDRVGRPSEFIKRPALTLGLAVQPDVLASLSDTPAFRGRGLLARFLYGLPPSLAGTRTYNQTPIDAETRRRYGRAVERILDLPDAGTEDDPTHRHALLLTGDALTLWAKYHDAIEARTAEGEDLCGIRDWASKLAGAVARIAGGFHLLENAGGDWQKPISVETVAAAWAIGETYLVPHALAAFGEMRADPGLVLARRILGWIERKKLTEFTLRECHQAHRSVSSPRNLEPALVVLSERGFLRLAETQPQEGGGRPKSPLYQVNPLTQNTQKSQN